MCSDERSLVYPPNCAFKPTVGDRLQINQALSASDRSIRR
jgi:hypothetical protein